MPEEAKDALAVAKLTDVLDEVQRKEVIRNLLRRVDESVAQFYEAFMSRRNKLLEINAVYHNKSHFDRNRVEWQTQSFYPLTYDAVENKTSILHQALMGDKLLSPYTVLGRTAEDHAYAGSAEMVLNNTMDRIGFFDTSEDVLRSTVKYGMGVYFYGWERRDERELWREPERDEKGKVRRDKNGRAILRFTKRNRRISQPFIRAVDIVDHFGYDPTCRKIDKWACDYTFMVDDMTPEMIREQEKQGEFWEGTFARLPKPDPHALDIFGDTMNADKKEPRMRRELGISDQHEGLKPNYRVVRWYGWFDINNDGVREFVEVASIPDRKLILKAKERLVAEHPFVDIQFVRALHGLAPRGVVDPVLKLQYDINERRNQRGDALKYVVNPQALINVDAILEDHAYVSAPGMLHPFHGGFGNQAEDVQKFFRVVGFPTSGEALSFEEEDRDIAQFSKTTGVADLNKALLSSNKDTPASTVISIFNQQQAGSSLVVNGILNRHGVLGSRILKQIQLFGDEEFIIRTAGRRGLEFRAESMENILGDYDVKVTTSTFFGSKPIELSMLAQLRPILAQEPHIDRVELDRVLLEGIVPKRVEKILQSPEVPLAPLDEMLLFMHGQGEGITVNMQEDLFALRAKVQFHERRTAPIVRKMAQEDGETLAEFNTYLENLRVRMQQLEQEEALRAQAASRVGQQVQGTNGNQANTGLPQVRAAAQQSRPRTNNLEF